MLVLNWHGIGDPPRDLDPGEARTWVPTASFESVLDAVADRSDVMITFDDGNVSDVEIALPLLLERNLSAQFFLPAGLIGEPGRLDESGIRKLTGTGMTIGSHGWAHRDWRRLRPVEVKDEYERAPEELGRITDQRIDIVAIPFGSYDRDVIGRLRDQDVRRVYTSDGGRTDPQQWLQSRFSVRRDTTAEDIRAMLAHRPAPRERMRRAAVMWAKRNRPTSGMGGFARE
ncbi:polysaccharide deacetylase family protein [Pseudonocardia sp. 73-21]|uniref:polysaccharide deacetylase family protein n=1 Tax=Pseudonocardia sp. 73-21 TaxID=1895809 RepID=UPI00262834E1|nr:polysaccharide deacetylase family protein [Pseudonocardia sp. 73-21]